MQTALVTGATSGIGLTIATELSENGFKVYGTSRHLEESQHKFDFELLPLDVTSNTSIQNCIDLLKFKL